MNKELRDRILDMYAEQRQRLIDQVADEDDFYDQRKIAVGIAQDLDLTTAEVLSVIRAKRWT